MLHLRIDMCALRAKKCREFERAVSQSQRRWHQSPAIVLLGDDSRTIQLERLPIQRACKIDRNAIRGDIRFCCEVERAAATASGRDLRRAHAVDQIGAAGQSPDTQRAITHTPRLHISLDRGCAFPRQQIGFDLAPIDRNLRRPGEARTAKIDVKHGMLSAIDHIQLDRSVSRARER